MSEKMSVEQALECLERVNRAHLVSDAMTAKASTAIATLRAEVAGLREMEALLREAVPFIGWTGAPDGLVDRCHAALDRAREVPREGE